MDKKQVKKVIDKNLKLAQKKGAVIRQAAVEKSGQIEKLAVKEYEKVKKEMEVTSKKVEGYIKKNPGKAALISAGIGAALGTAVALLISNSVDKPTKKKK